MQVNKKEVGERIKSIRLSMGMTMEGFGELFNANKATVNNWEKGRNLPIPKTLSNVAFQGQISVDELLYGKKKPCYWKEVDYADLWESNCGLTWCFENPCSNPKDHIMNYCPKCGKELVIDG